jgi:F-type H+-transporting ATPase subunit delta
MERIDRSATLSREGLPGRYAAALFDLANDAKALDATADALATLNKAMSESPELAAMVRAPQLKRQDAARAIGAIAAALKLPRLVGDFLGVVAGNGRLALLPSIIAAFNRMLASHKGSSTARITAAHELSAAQQKSLAAKLKARTGRSMDLDITVDPAILGGLIVRIGSEQIDSSVRTRLDRLGQQMKGL